MPTEKFMNLGDYKKQAILDAMRAEFMTTPYSEIRISSLIKRAGISRASLSVFPEQRRFVYLYDASTERAAGAGAGRSLPGTEKFI